MIPLVIALIIPLVLALIIPLAIIVIREFVPVIEGEPAASVRSLCSDL